MHHQSDERLVRVMKEHWMKYVPSVIIYILLTGISVLLFFFAGMGVHHYMWLSHSTFLIALTLLCVSHHWFFWTLLNEDLGLIIITDRRVIFMEIRLLSQDHIYEISFEKMRMVHARKQGLFQNIFRYGTVWSEGGLNIPLVPHPNSVVRDIERAMGMK
ncbi:hypothetical protein HYZ99_05380 [Candidatus Peregrinibacteria bacterium]|nr:hypothetical protein [Candidatus Peregrinibacteria bacterium]